MFFKKRHGLFETVLLKHEPIIIVISLIDYFKVINNQFNTFYK